MAKILSIPVCGVATKKDIIEPLLAPCLFNDAETGMTPHEHKGNGIPYKTAFRFDKKPCLPICDSIFSCETKTDNSPAKAKPSRRYGDISTRRVTIAYEKSIR